VGATIWRWEAIEWDIAGGVGGACPEAVLATVDEAVIWGFGESEDINIGFGGGLHLLDWVLGEDQFSSHGPAGQREIVPRRQIPGELIHVALGGGHGGGSGVGIEV
jgi:hypothetical protein